MCLIIFITPSGLLKIEPFQITHIRIIFLESIQYSLEISLISIRISLSSWIGYEPCLIKFLGNHHYLVRRYFKYFNCLFLQFHGCQGKWLLLDNSPAFYLSDKSSWILHYILEQSGCKVLIVKLISFPSELHSDVVLLNFWANIVKRF
jgi:hypothetical protein